MASPPSLLRQPSCRWGPWDPADPSSLTATLFVRFEAPFPFPFPLPGIPNCSISLPAEGLFWIGGLIVLFNWPPYISRLIWIWQGPCPWTCQLPSCVNLAKVFGTPSVWTGTISLSMCLSPSGFNFHYWVLNWLLALEWLSCRLVWHFKPLTIMYCILISSVVSLSRINSNNISACKFLLCACPRLSLHFLDFSMDVSYACISSLRLSTSGNRFLVLHVWLVHRKPPLYLCLQPQFMRLLFHFINLLVPLGPLWELLFVWPAFLSTLKFPYFANPIIIPNFILISLDLITVWFASVWLSFCGCHSFLLPFVLVVWKLSFAFQENWLSLYVFRTRAGCLWVFLSVWLASVKYSNFLFDRWLSVALHLDFLLPCVNPSIIPPSSWNSLHLFTVWCDSVWLSVGGCHTILPPLVLFVRKLSFNSHENWLSVITLRLRTDCFWVFLLFWLASVKSMNFPYHGCLSIAHHLGILLPCWLSLWLSLRCRCFTLPSAPPTSPTFLPSRLLLNVKLLLSFVTTLLLWCFIVLQVLQSRTLFIPMLPDCWDLLLLLSFFIIFFSWVRNPFFVRLRKSLPFCRVRSPFFSRLRKSCIKYYNRI